MSKQNTKRGIVVAAALLLVAAIGGTILLSVNSQAAESPPQNERQYTVTRGTITVGIEAEGKLAAEKISAGVSDGIVLGNLLVREGQQVKKGDRLAELSVAEAKKNAEHYQKAYEKVEETLEEVQEDREDYLLSLNWLLEKQKRESYNTYQERYWELKNEIGELKSHISEAERKKTWSDQGELLDSSLSAMRKERDEKTAALEKLEADRENQKDEEDDLTLQKKKQANKLEKYDETVRALEQELKRAEQNRKKAESRFITAPQDGVVLKLNYKKGDTVKGGTAVVELGDLTKLSLKLNLEPENIVDVEKEQPVEFFVDAYPEKIFTGKVADKKLVQNSEGKYEITVEVPPTGELLLDGMNAGATIILKQKKDVLTLQNKAIYLENGKQYVKVRNAEGELVKKEIKAGFSDGRLSEIVEGLAEGDAVVYEDTP